MNMKTDDIPKIFVDSITSDIRKIYNKFMIKWKKKVVIKREDWCNYKKATIGNINYLILFQLYFTNYQAGVIHISS